MSIRIRTFGAGNVVALVVSLGEFGLLFALPLFALLYGARRVWLFQKTTPESASEIRAASRLARGPRVVAVGDHPVDPRGLWPADFDLLGPAPLLRLRNRHRAQLIGKTDRPRALATRAASLLAAAAPAMRRAGLTVVVDVDPQSV